MKNLYSKLQLILVIVLFSAHHLNAQKNNSIWTKITKEKIGNAEKVIRKSEPNKAYFFQLDIEKLKTQLINAPLRGDSPKISNLVIQFPNAEGEMESFRVKEAPVMAPKLQAKYPDIRSYVGQSINNPSSIMRISITPHGLYTLVLGAKSGIQYINPYTANLKNYIVYSKQDLFKLSNDFECGFEENNYYERS
ncbi:MAG: hypothetical protein P8X62_00850, partial [Flavobacteriaceae bacterium]